MTILESLTNFDYIWFLSNIFSYLTFESFLKLLAVYFFIVWIAIIVWVTKDIINRTNNILYQIFSILTVLIWTPLWIVVYLLIRPSKTLFEKYYEEVQLDDEESWDFELEKDETQEVEIKKVISKTNCPECNYEINSDYKFCPNCRKELKKFCIWCSKEINPEWTLCPYCGKNQDDKLQNILWKEDIKKELETKKDEKIPEIINENE